MDKLLEALRMQIIPSSEGEESFNTGIKWIESLSEEERQSYFAECVSDLENLPRREKRPYYKFSIARNKIKGYCLIIIFWPPGGETRPHIHSDSQAKIKVLKGTLSETNFTLMEPKRNLRRFFIGRTYDSLDETIVESPDSIHSVKNCSKYDWAASLHLFMPELIEMEIYDFEENWRYNINGDADTRILGARRPKNAAPIWGK